MVEIELFVVRDCSFSNIIMVLGNNVIKFFYYMSFQVTVFKGEIRCCYLRLQHRHISYKGFTNVSDNLKGCIRISPDVDNLTSIPPRYNTMII